jgi:hypothetical protein
MLVKNPRPKVMKEISYNGNEGNGTIESTIHDILSEQRKTRMLLERLVAKMDQDITTSN